MKTLCIGIWDETSPDIYSSNGIGREDIEIPFDVLPTAKNPIIIQFSKILKFEVKVINDSVFDILWNNNEKKEWVSFFTPLHNEEMIDIGLGEPCPRWGRYAMFKPFQNNA